ncbi:TraB/GumN family protein [Pedobacter sp. Du54]|uniref:TraB/GumN family protein n=1 Tax=Pedobacter anseongensis TaxID=3133439 RepID=UPI0030A1AD17
MIKYLLIGFLSLALNSKAQQKKNENSLLWEISGNGLQKPSYLFGTYHYAGKDFIDTMKVLNAKLNQADIIVGELIIDSTLTKRLVPFMIMTDNSLDKLLSPKEYQNVSDYLKKVSGYELQTFNIMKPVTVQMTILQFTAPKSTITPANPALDQYIQDYGKANHKIVVGLETAEDQATVLFGSSLQRQKELLLKSIGNEKKNKKESQKLYDDYIAQDLMSLEKTFKKIEDYTPAESESLLKTRNLKWMAQLPDLMQNGSLFIAVGAGHLVGQDGLIKALQKKGFTVKPLATN